MMLDSQGSLEPVFDSLFSLLRQADYSWKPLSPDRLLEERRQSAAYPALERCFGLGVSTTIEELEMEGFSPELAREVLALAPAISRSGSFLIPHAHWAGNSFTEYVYLGQESYELIRKLQERLETFENARVLDLGSGSGVLSFEVSALASRVLGIDSSLRAVRWAQAAARVQGLKNIEFRQARIGTSVADHAVGESHWDVALMNPPLAVSVPGENRPHRDGGDLGIEIPLLFLQFAHRHLKKRGSLFTLVTNPIVNGRPAFFDRLDRKCWEITERHCLHDRFNHTLYRRNRYEERGISRIELWFLHLRKL